MPIMYYEYDADCLPANRPLKVIAGKRPGSETSIGWLPDSGGNSGVQRLDSPTDAGDSRRVVDCMLAAGVLCDGK